MSDPTIKLTGKLVGDEELLANLNDLNDLTMTKYLVAAATAGALLIINSAKDKAPKKTRTLARSIHQETLEADRHYIEIGIGTDLEYAAMQEFGGTVVPKKAQFLAIPQNSGAEAVGSPLNYPGNLVPIFWTSGGSGVLMDDSGEVQYVLVRSAVIPAHPYLRPAFDEQGDNALDKVGKYLGMILERLVG